MLSPESRTPAILFSVLLYLPVLEITFRNVLMQLLPEKALYLPQQASLWIADPHFGKVSHFRKAGIAVPARAGEENLRVLKELLERHQPREVIFLGDLFHSGYNAEWPQLLHLLQSYPHTQFILVKGNHDILHQWHYQSLTVCKQWHLNDAFTLTHHPENTEAYNVCGHLHPGVKLQGKGRQQLRLPCFYFGEKGAVLPAFGQFTGLHFLQPQPRDKIYVCTGQKVVETPFNEAAH